MKSDVIRIDSNGGGFEQTQEEIEKFSSFNGLSQKETLHLQLLKEEMLSLIRSLTGQMQSLLWIEGENRAFELHLQTEAVMDKDTRALLLSASSSRKNEAAKGFLGKLRDSLERALAADHPSDYEQIIPQEVWYDIPADYVDESGWDGYERSILRRLSDEVKISIRGKSVDVIVIKSFR